MKPRKANILGTLVILAMIYALVTVAARPQKTNASWYSNPTIFSDTMNPGDSFVNEKMFGEQQEGFVTLEGDVFTPNWTGLMNVSGYCRVKYPTDGLSVNIFLLSGGSIYVAQSDNSMVTFTATLPAQPLKIAIGQSNDFNFMGCNLLLQAVK